MHSRHCQNGGVGDSSLVSQPSRTPGINRMVGKSVMAAKLAVLRRRFEKYEGGQRSPLGGKGMQQLVATQTASPQDGKLAAGSDETEKNEDLLALGDGSMDVVEEPK